MSAVTSSLAERGYVLGPHAQIFEIDICTSYLDIPMSKNDVLRIVPKEAYGYFNSEASARKFGAAVLDIVISRLNSFGGGVVWWRIRPEFASVGRCQPCYGDAEPWGCYLRFATSPDLPSEDWEKIKALESVDKITRCQPCAGFEDTGPCENEKHKSFYAALKSEGR